MQSTVKSMREAKGWSQETLAEMSGLSTRTIQRIECGQRAGLESWKSLAAVFETTIRDLQGESDMKTTINHSHLTDKELKALQEVRQLRSWYINLTSYALVILSLFIINWMTSPDYWWVVWPALGWGLGIAIRGLKIFTPWWLFDDDWERREVEKRIGHKL